MSNHVTLCFAKDRSIWLIQTIDDQPFPLASMIWNIRGRRDSAATNTELSTSGGGRKACTLRPTWVKPIDLAWVGRLGSAKLPVCRSLLTIELVADLNSVGASNLQLASNRLTLQLQPTDTTAQPWTADLPPFMAAWSLGVIGTLGGCLQARGVRRRDQWVDSISNWYLAMSWFICFRYCYTLFT